MDGLSVCLSVCALCVCVCFFFPRDFVFVLPCFRVAASLFLLQKGRPPPLRGGTPRPRIWGDPLFFFDLVGGPRLFFAGALPRPPLPHTPRATPLFGGMPRGLSGFSRKKSAFLRLFLRLFYGFRMHFCENSSEKEKKGREWKKGRKKVHFS